MVSKVNTGREVALKLLLDTFRKRSFTGHLLDATLSEKRLKREDKALATELFYGSLRYGHQLQWILNQYLKSDSKLPPFVIWSLTMALYQGYYLSRIPDYAIVNETCNLIRKKDRGGSLVSLANAVLRKALADKGKRDHNEDMPHWIHFSFPEWISQRWSKQWGDFKMATIMEALNSRSPTYLRVNQRSALESNIIRDLGKAGLTCKPSGLKNCIEVTSTDLPLKNWPGYRENWWSVQNLASQKIIPCLGAQKGESILEACSGFGGKTLQLAEILGGAATIAYFDTQDKKMRALRLKVKQMGLKNVVPYQEESKRFDRVFVDAPCSGLGTISSHPEIKWFRREEDVLSAHRNQISILEEYGKKVKPSGVLFYAVCSIDKQEGEGTARAFLEKNSDFEIDSSFDPPWEKGDPGFYLLPTDKGTSGYYACRLLKKA